MLRREFLAAATAAPLIASPRPAPVKLGIDLFSLRSQKWTPFEYLDYCAQQQAKVVHFSEVRFIGSLEPDNLRQVRRHAEELGIELEIGMRSICPTSTMFDPKAGTAEEQLTRMIEAARIVGSKIVRAVLGGMDDRKSAPIGKHIENTVTVLRKVRSRAVDSGIKVAIENHAGDMQGHELKGLIEAAGRDFVGACLDSGNPTWTLESPHTTLDVLAPYVLTSHVRDSAVWATPNGAAVTWVRMGEGKVAIAEYVQKYASLCPGRALSLESIVFGPKTFAYKDPTFWDAYRDVPAWDFEQFVKLAEHGNPQPERPWDRPDGARLEREDLEASLAFTKKLLNAPTA